MPIRKRGDVYWIDIRLPGGERLRRSAGTSDRKEAQEYHDKVKAEAWRVTKLGEKPSRTFAEAAVRYLIEQSGSKDYESKERHILHFRESFRGEALDKLTRDRIIAALPQTYMRGKTETQTSNATKNRYLATIRAMLNDAAGLWEWINRAPTLEDLVEPSKRIRWITPEEAQKLLKAIKTDWLRDVATLALSTGLRRGNIFGLEWSQVDLVRRRAWIHPDQAKAGKPIGVPLNDEAVEVIRRQIGKHQTRVFVRNGEPLEYLDNVQWKGACKRAGISDFRFHDLRHTWASWHIQNGTPLQTLMEMGGWASYEMVLRYAHLAPDHLAEHANSVTIWAQVPRSFEAQQNKKAG